MLMVKRLTDTAKIPARATECSAGLDLYADESITIMPHNKQEWVKTGIAIKLDPYHYGCISPRSGLASKMITVDAGIIDSDYTGPLKVLMINRGICAYRVHAGDRIAQLVIVPVARPELTIMDALPVTERGANGFGSSGV